MSSVPDPIADVSPTLPTEAGLWIERRRDQRMFDQDRRVVELLSYLRTRDVTRCESTPEAGQAWTAHPA